MARLTLGLKNLQLKRKSPKVQESGGSGTASSRAKVFFNSVCSSLSFPSKQVPETCADRWSTCVTVCLVLSERRAEGHAEPPALALGGPSLRDRERRSGNWAHMMFFHRHKGDLGEIQGGAKRATILWEWWKTGGEEWESSPRQQKREREREYETLSYTPLRFSGVWRHVDPGGGPHGRSRTRGNYLPLPQ